MIEKIISGGQTGVDQAALEAAWQAGFVTGGWAPKGWRTLKGPNPKLREYGLKEHASRNYRDRTWANVEMADATIRIFRVSNSPGELCTAKACHYIFSKPVLDVDLRDPIKPHHLAAQIRKEWKILNIAGNSEQTSPGITIAAFDYLTAFFLEI